MKRKFIAILLVSAMLLTALPLSASAVGDAAAKPPLHGLDVFRYLPEAATWMEAGLNQEEWGWGYRILYWMLWPWAKLAELIWPPMRPVVECLANFFVELFNPPLPEFKPGPEPPSPAVTKHSVAGYKILYREPIVPEAVNTDKTAAQILADTLNQITGGTGFTAAAGTPTGANEFLIGAVSGADVSSLGADGYLIEPKGSSGIVIAGGKRGVIYGVYRFLEKYFDCHWYTHDFAVIPTGPAEIAAVKAESYAPALEFRETDWISPRYEAYSLANGLNGNVYRSLAESKGGTFGYNGGMAHTIINNFLGGQALFDAHPEWYAWRDDKNARVQKQLCLTNDEVLAEMTRLVLNQLRGGNGQPIVSVTQDDNQDYCQCAKCKAVDTQEGSHAGTMIRFVNAIADAVKTEFPNALIDTFAYQYTRTPPKLTRPRDNVIVRLCSIECCFAHSLDDPKCAENVKFAADIKTWSQISNHLYIWDYTTNYGHYNCIFPDFGVLQRNMQFFVANNVKGIYEEGNYQAAASNSEFAELRAYLLARLMWDPDMDYGAEMNGFLKAYYGGGWQYMREFIDLTIANAGAKWPHSKMGIYISPTDKDLLNLKLNQIRYADQLWAKAIELAGDTMAGAETCKQRVLRSQLSWRFWKGCNRAVEFWRLQAEEKWQAANEQLYKDFKAFGITQYREGGGTANYNWRFLPDPPPNWWGTPMDWRG